MLTMLSKRFTCFTIFEKRLGRGLVCVPKHNPPDPKDLNKLQSFLEKNDKILILTGAGISTESGIPDYRSEEVGLYARTNHKPIQYQEFVKSEYARKRYWARNFIGWPKFSKIEPNITHLACRDLELAGKVTALVTQNVDRLHHKAGSSNIVELHGTGYTVSCLTCDYKIDRESLQKKLLEANPDMKATFTMMRPDGDVDLSKEQEENFKPPLCPDCGSSLKPDIIFFGDNVPRHIVNAVRQAVSESQAILVLGTSLTVYSSYRIVLQGKEEGKTIWAINIGPTRADDMLSNKISGKCGDILPCVSNIVLGKS